MSFATVPFAQKDGNDPSPTLQCKCHSNHPVTVWGHWRSFLAAPTAQLCKGVGLSVSLPHLD